MFMEADIKMYRLDQSQNTEIQYPTFLNDLIKLIVSLKT